MYDARWLSWVGCDDKHTNTQTNKKHRDFTAHCYNVGVLDDKHTNTKHEGVFRTLLQSTMWKLVDWGKDHTAIINGKCENVDDNCVSELFS